MKIINGTDNFRKLVHRVMDFDVTNAHLPIEPDNVLMGYFDISRAEELEKFCKDYPEYHVMSLVSGSLLYANSIVPNSKFLMLATGSKDPNIFCAIKITQRNIESSHVLEFDRD